MEYIEGIKGFDPLEDLWGERFRGWYTTKVFNRNESVTITDNITYQFKICDFQYKFIIPERVEFFNGIGDGGKLEYGVISYTEPERGLGVFRYPLSESGFFSSPVSALKTAEKILDLSIEQLQDMISKKKVLTFEAFRLPFFGYQYFDVSDFDFNEIEKINGKKNMEELKVDYLKGREDKVSEIKNKILSLPNYLLILQNVLDLKFKNESEIFTMTDGVIHFGI